MLIVKNFGPIKFLIHEFDQKVVLLMGENLTDEGQESNGSGKSYLLTAMEYCLKGSCNRKVTDSELVREGQKEAYICLELHSKALQSTLVIERTIYANSKSSTCEINFKGQKNHKITSVGDGNKFILDQLGLTKTDIDNYFFISKEKYKSFFVSSDTEKKELIARFSKANLIDKVFDKIFEDIEKQEDLITKKQKDIDKIESKISVYQDLLQKDEESNDQEKIVKLEDSVIHKKNEIKFIDTKVNEINRALKKAELELTKMAPKTDLVKKLNALKTEKSALKSELRELEKSYTETKNIISELENDLMGLITCPNCGHEFSTDPDVNIQLSRESKKEAEEVQKDLENEIGEYEIKDQETNELIEQFQEKILLIDKQKQNLNFKIKNYENNIARAKGEKENIERSIKIDLQSIEALNNKEEKNYDKLIKEFENEKKLELKKLDKLNDKLKFYKEWNLNFFSFKNYLINKSLATINAFTNNYLEKLGSSLTVRLEGFKEDKKGKITEKITPKIFKFGREAGNFGKLSGGEKARVELAVILALSGIINSSTNGRGLDFISIDEILESLDQKGLHNTLKAMNAVNQQIMLVTHGKLETREGYEPLIMVKENNISSKKY